MLNSVIVLVILQSLFYIFSFHFLLLIFSTFHALILMLPTVFMFNLFYFSFSSSLVLLFINFQLVVVLLQLISIRHQGNIFLFSM